MTPILLISRLLWFGLFALIVLRFGPFQGGNSPSRKRCCEGGGKDPMIMASCHGLHMPEMRPSRRGQKTG
jgi:hypothetical protein